MISSLKKDREMRKYQTKIALVTGASRRLGKNTALTLAKKWVDVIVTDRNIAVFVRDCHILSLLIEND